MCKHILVVDDEDKVAFSLAEVLNEDLGVGYQVATATSGEEALASISNQVVDLIVTDLRMPGINGFDFIRQARRVVPHALFILITARWSESVSTTASSLGVFRCLPKPFSKRLLVKTVQHALDAGKPPGTRMTTLAEDTAEKITAALETLRVGVHARSILLVSISGQMLTGVGDHDGIDVNILSSLIGASFATSSELNRYLGQSEASTLHYHANAEFEIYSANINQEHLVVLLLDRQASASPIGLVWLYTRRTLDALRTLLQDSQEVVSGDVLDEAFDDLLLSSMDDLYPRWSRSGGRCTWR